MRWFLAIFILFLAASTAAAQVDDPAVSVVNVIPIPTIPSGASNSVIDHNGRLFIFDVTFENTMILTTEGVYRFARSAKTRVTVIESDGTTKRDGQYNGSFQIAGVGRYAVYAIVNDYGFSMAASQTPVPITIVRRLVALGPVFPTLPSLDVPLQADVKVSAVGDDGTPDSIAFVDVTPSPIILNPTDAGAPVPAIPTRLRTVRMFQSDGKSFTPLTPSPIPIP